MISDHGNRYVETYASSCATSMSDWLNIRLVVGTVLVTTFTSVGLLGLWAATSRWHWFLRMGIALIVLSPLLLIPAYEPLLLLLVQLAVVAMGVIVYRRRCSRRSRRGVGLHDGNAPSRRPSIRFSLSTIMLATALAGIALATAVRIPHEVWFGWADYLLTGATFGAAVLLSAWLVYGRPRWIVRLGVSAVVAVTLSIPQAYFNDWPEDIVDTLESVDFTNWPNWSIPVWTTIWFAVVPAALLLVAINLLLLRAAGLASLACGGPARARGRRAVRYLLATSSAVLLAATSIPPVTTCWKLLHPLPIPAAKLPDPNGYEDLVAAGKMFDSPILNTAVEPQSTGELAAEVAKYSKAYDRCRLGLSREVVCPIWGEGEDLAENQTLWIEDFSSIRSLARALSMKSELARRELRHADAATVARDIIRLASAMERHGTVLHLLVGVAIEGMGKASLCRVTGELSPETCRELVHELSVIEERREPLDEILHRDRILSENAYGWSGHLFEFLWDLAGGGSVKTQLMNNTYPRAVATSRLLIITLALRAYTVERGGYPNELRQLVPDYLRSLPADPFGPKDESFVYRLVDGGYVLYSLGPNRRDDGGVPQKETTDGYTGWDTGDLRLDTLYKLEEEATEEVNDDRGAN